MSPSLVFILFVSAAFGSLSGLVCEPNLWILSGLSAALCCLVLVSKNANIKRAALFSFIFVLGATKAGVDYKEYQNTQKALPQERTVLEGTITQIGLQFSGHKKAVLSLMRPEFKRANLHLHLAAGAAISEIHAGDKVRVFGKIKLPTPSLFPGDFDSLAFGFSRAIHGSIYLSNQLYIEVLEPAKKHWFSFSELRTDLTHFLLARITPYETGLILSRFAGDKGFLQKDQKEIYRQSGTAHLLAVSGLQVSVFAWLIFAFFEILFALLLQKRTRFRASTLAAIPVAILMLFFLGFCGSGPSAVRATLMAFALLAGRLHNRLISPFDLLGAAGLSTVLVDPSAVLDPGFLFSYFAVFGLLLFGSSNVIKNLELGFFAKPLILLCSSIFAAAFTIPISIYYFGSFAPFGALANMVVIPLAAFLQIPSLLALLLGILTEQIGLLEFSANLLGYCEAVCAGFANILGSLLFAQISGFEGFLACLLSLVTLTLFAFQKFRPAVLLSIGLASLIFLPTFWKPKTTQITFLAVGQGDAAFLQTPHGKNILIDGGGALFGRSNPYEKIVAPFLKRQGVKHIDLVVLSHPDPDHIKGLISVLDELPVGEIWHSGFGHDHPLMRILLEKALEKHIPVRRAKELLGTHVIDDVFLDILAPHPHNRDDLFFELSPNENSLVLRIRYAGHSVLLPGDLELWGERYLLRDYSNLKSTIVKAPHHGSKTSSSQAFISACGAEHVVFCTGPDNLFGFPHSEVVLRWQQSGAQTWNTGENGEVQFSLSRNGVFVKPFRKSTR